MLGILGHKSATETDRDGEDQHPVEHSVDHSIRSTVVILILLLILILILILTFHRSNPTHSLIPPPHSGFIATNEMGMTRFDTGSAALSAKHHDHDMMIIIGQLLHQPDQMTMESISDAHKIYGHLPASRRG